MKRIVFSILAAGVAAAMGAQTGSPATASPVSPAAAPGAIAIIDAQRLALESAPGKEALREAPEAVGSEERGARPGRAPHLAPPQVC